MITDLIAAFMEDHVGQASNTSLDLNAKMIFKEYDYAEFEGVDIDTTGAFDPSFTNLNSQVSQQR
jgi:hypothetical protein